MLVELSSALATCHDLGVVHRDIKPRDLVVKRGVVEPWPVLIDFGLAHVETGPRLTPADEAVGNARFSPFSSCRWYTIPPPQWYTFSPPLTDYAERRVTLAGHPVQLTAIEYGLLFELSANAGRVMTYDRLLQRVWGLRGSGDSRRVRTAAKQLRRKLGDDANNPTYILNEPRVGYRMEKGEEKEREGA